MCGVVKLVLTPYASAKNGKRILNEANLDINFFRSLEEVPFFNILEGFLKIRFLASVLQEINLTNFFRPNV